MALSPRSRMLMATLCAPLLACAGTDSTVEGSLDGPDRMLDWEREVVHTVGGFEATDWDAFGDVGDVGFDAAGNIYILDTQAFRVSVVSPEGELVRSFGSQGEGPGELQRPQSLAVFPDGSVAVYDMGKFGFIAYGADGEWIRDITASDRGNIDMLGNLTAAGPGIASGEGSVIAERIGRIRMSSGGNDVDASVGAEPEGDPVVRADLGESLDPTVVFRAWEPPEPEGPDEEVGGESEGGGSFQIRMGPLRAFTPDLDLAALPDGRFAVSDSTSYRIRVFRADGTEAGEITRPIDPVTVTPQIETREQDRRRTELEAQMAEGEGGVGGAVVMLGGSGTRQMSMPNMDEARMNQIENMVFYPEIPAISDLAADWEGRLWIQRPGAEPGERGPIDIITLEGAYVGTLSPDGPETPVAFGPNGLAAWIEVDDLDIQTVVVARIADRSPTT